MLTAILRNFDCVILSESDVYVEILAADAAELASTLHDAGFPCVTLDSVTVAVERRSRSAVTVIAEPGTRHPLAVAFDDCIRRNNVRPAATQSELLSWVP